MQTVGWAAAAVTQMHWEGTHLLSEAELSELMQMLRRASIAIRTANIRRSGPRKVGEEVALLGGWG